MKLLFDQNISFRIIAKISTEFHGCAQVRSLGLENKTDSAIWQYARENNYCIVTFDSDFIDLAMLKGFPPKVIWLKIGNSLTSQIVEKLFTEKQRINEFLQNAEVAFLELN